MSTLCMYTTQGDLNCSKSEKVSPSTRQFPNSLINSKEHFDQPATPPVTPPLWNPNDNKHKEVYNVYNVEPANVVLGHFNERHGSVE